MADGGTDDRWTVQRVADRLHRWRKYGRRITQNDLYWLSGISETLICDYEKGKRQPGMGNFLLVLSSLRLTPKDFFDEKKEAPERGHRLNARQTGLHIQLKNQVVAEKTAAGVSPRNRRMCRS